MKSSVAFDELPAWLAEATHGDDDNVAVLAGHYAIFSPGSIPVDLLDGNDARPAGAAEMVDFTRRTWQLACDVARAHSDRRFRLVTLVDDIQFVRPVVADRATSERLADALARDYLDSVRELPPWHAREFAARALDSNRIVRCRDDRWLFSERELRRAAVRRLRARIDTADGTGGVTLSDNGNTMTVSLPEQGDYCLVHSGHTSCAGAYVELLARLHEGGVRKLIAFVPMRCFAQVVLGVQLARQLLGLKGFEVVNVGLPGEGAGAGVVSF